MSGSIRLPDIARWPLPPPPDRSADLVASLSPVTCTFPLMPVHVSWLTDCTSRYGFDDVDETLRHLIYLSNSEPPGNKRLIFRIKRCLHCHVGARSSQHTKEDVEVVIHRFQIDWLRVVTDNCQIKSLDKSVRIICDYYQSRVERARNEGGDAAASARELDIFSVRRDEDVRLTDALARERLDRGGNGDSVSRENDRPVGHETAPDGDGGRGCDLGDLADDPAACGQEETLRAIARCQVGRASSSYAEARGESAEETERRREDERRVEESDEARQGRALIAKALGSVMG